MLLLLDREEVADHTQVDNCYCKCVHKLIIQHVTEREPLSVLREFSTEEKGYHGKQTKCQK